MSVVRKVLAVVGALLALAFLSSAPAQAAALPGRAVGPHLTLDTDPSDIGTCQKLPTTLFIPEDVGGQKWDVFCRNGMTGTLDLSSFCQQFSKHIPVSWLQPCGSPQTLKDWADGAKNLGGQFSFNKLDANGGTDHEPCAILNSATNKPPWKGNPEECTYIEPQNYVFQPLINDYATPCEQWIKVIQDAYKADPKNVAKYPAPTDAGFIDDCVSAEPLFQNQYRFQPFGDSHTDYPTNQYTAPSTITDPLSNFLGIADWIGLAVCVVGVLLCAGKMAMAYRGGGEEAVVGVMWVLFACVMLGSVLGIAQMVLNF